jgi:hypothetical protein
MRLNDLVKRLTALEARLGVVLDVYLLRSGERATLPKNQRLQACVDVLAGRPTERARVMLEAVSTSGGDRLHELCQALAAGPVPRGQFHNLD